MTWTIGACVGGILAVVLSQFLLAAQHRIANPPLGESEELWREAEAHALGYITLCKASETEYDRTTVTAKLEDHFPDLHPRACHLIALAALGTSKNK
jgi:hypothetical protein